MGSISGQREIEGRAGGDSLLCAEQCIDAELFQRVCSLVHSCTELRVPAIYVLPIDSGLSVWWSVEYAT
jgi:hypothetical protein